MVQDKKIETLDTVLEERNMLARLETQHRKAWMSSDRQMRLAQEIMVEHGDAEGSINDDALYAQYRSHMDSAAYFQRQADSVKRLFEAHLDTHEGLVKVKSEPRTYSPLREDSWFLDKAAVATDPTGSTIGGAQAKERLTRYGQECAAEVRANSAEGRHVLRAVREQYRSDGHGERTAMQITHEAERRAADSGSSSLGAFVTPVYLLAESAKYLSPVAAFTDESNDQPMPQYGLAIHIPSFSTGSSVGQQMTENTGIDSSTPTGAYISDPIPVVTQAGTVNVSQQLHDRGGVPGAGFDVILLAQLTEQLDAAVDAYVIATVIATGTTVTDSTTVTVSRFYDDLSTARENLRNTAGVRLSASHVFAHSDFIDGWLFDQVDGSQRPLIVPDPQSLIASSPAGSLEVDTTFTGVWFNRQRLFADDNILPYTGEPTWAQVLVADMSKVLTWRSDSIAVVAPETNAADLSVLISLRQYVAAVSQYGPAIQILSGSGYASLS